MLDTWGDNDRTESQLLCNPGKTSGLAGLEVLSLRILPDAYCMEYEFDQEGPPDKSRSPAQRVLSQAYTSLVKASMDGVFRLNLLRWPQEETT